MNRNFGCVFRLSVALLISSLVARASSLAHNEPRVPSHELRFRFRPGDKFALVSVAEQKTSRHTDANELLSEQTVRFEYDFDVDEVEADGCIWAKYACRRVALKVRGKDTVLDYDSDASRLTSPAKRGEQKVPPQVLPWLLAIEEPFFVRITPQGRITNINGLSAVVGNAKSKLPNVAVKDLLIQAVEQQFAEEKVRRELEEQLAVFPDANAGTIIIGDTWSRGQLSDGEKLSQQWIFRLKELRDGLAIVDVNTIVVSDAHKTPVFIDGLRANREFSGQGTGQIEIEKSTGQIINSTLTQDLVEKITFLPQGTIRRPPPAPAPARTHLVTTFQMLKRDSDQSPASPAPNQPSLMNF